MQLCSSHVVRVFGLPHSSVTPSHSMLSPGMFTPSHTACSVTFAPSHTVVKLFQSCSPLATQLCHVVRIRVPTVELHGRCRGQPSASRVEVHQGGLQRCLWR